MHPQGARGGSQRHADRSVTTRRKGPVERRAQIVNSRDVVCQPFVGWPRRRLRLGPFKQIQIASGMASRHRVELAGLNELFERISAGRFEQAIAYPLAPAVCSQKRFRDEVRNAIDDLRRRNLMIRRYRTRGLQCEAASEDCQATQHHALRFGQQLVAPVKRRSQCLMTWHCRAMAAREQPETVVEPARKALYSKGRDARRRKLDCQRDTVEATTNFGDSGRYACVRRKAWRGRACPLDEQPNGAVA